MDRNIKQNRIETFKYNNKYFKNLIINSAVKTQRIQIGFSLKNIDKKKCGRKPKLKDRIFFLFKNLLDEASY
ncbi:hypothetical protein BpHYR1_041129 [Brachionus plicatilis]|uniref:Uncharacterized protein n=1 Tax=Brachionus plicatilis TaxID=10195 RepID=A0A3M7S464_BRAPC|nr:hypothetical protein BpHYR1_041129 [Brachionus plicatilis]